MGSESLTRLVTDQDGDERIQVNWSISASWGPDDLSSITWSSSATDLDGETRWSAEASSGNGGRSAYENDLEIDSFKVVNHLGNTLSNQFSSMYPFPVDPGNTISIEGARFRVQRFEARFRRLLSSSRLVRGNHPINSAI